MRSSGTIDKKENSITMALKPLSFHILDLNRCRAIYASTLIFLMIYLPMMFIIMVTRNRSKAISISEEM